MYTQIKTYQGHTACSRHSLAEQSRALKAPLSIWHSEYLLWKHPMQAAHRFAVIPQSHDSSMPLLVCILCLMAWD